MSALPFPTFLLPLLHILASLLIFSDINREEGFYDEFGKLDFTCVRNGVILLVSNMFLLTSAIHPVTKIFHPIPEDTPSQERLERCRVRSLTVASIVIPLNFVLYEIYHWPYEEIAAFDLLPFLVLALIRYAKRGWRFARDLWVEPSQPEEAEARPLLDRSLTILEYHRRCAMLGAAFVFFSLAACGFAPAFNIPTWKASLFIAAAKLIADSALEYHAYRTLRASAWSRLSGSDPRGNWHEPRLV